jgi:hypothetical protein
MGRSSHYFLVFPALVKNSQSIKKSFSLSSCDLSLFYIPFDQRIGAGLVSGMLLQKAGVDSLDGVALLVPHLEIFSYH